jgi:two-component system chemotaxis response regulator CheV
VKTKDKKRYDVYYDELISLISGDVNISSQYVIFTAANNEYYAINVAKVEELIQYKNIQIAKSSDSDDLTLGVAKIRDHLTVLLRFDDWLGLETDNKIEPKLIILCKYSSARLGLLVDSVVGIQKIEVDTLFGGTDRDNKIAYVVEITIGGQKKLCNIFDFDQLTMDIYPNIMIMNKNMVKEMRIEPKASKKMILIAEDSLLIQEQIRSLMDKIGLDYMIFENGKDLYDFLQNCELENVGLIVTDIEMPIMDGIELTKSIKESAKFKKLPVIAHTNMSNSAISANILKLGVCEIIDKLDVNKLKDAILRYSL